MGSILSKPVTETDREERLNSEIDRILDEVGQGVLGIQWQVVRSLRAGNRLSLRRGAGIEFDKLREFVPGEDEYRRIAPRKTLANGGDKLIVRENRPELQETHYLLMDVSPTHLFANLRESKLTLCARGAATACMAAEKMKDLVGFIAYADNKVVRHIMPTAPENIVREVIATIIEPPSARGDRESGLAQALELLPPVPTNVIWISDCLNMTAEERVKLKELSGHHRILSVVPQDWREQFLPEPPLWWPIPYMIDVFDLRTHRRYAFLCTRRKREQYTREWAEHTDELKAFFEDAGIASAVVQTEHAIRRAVYRNQKEREDALKSQRMDAIQDMVALFASP